MIKTSFKIRKINVDKVGSRYLVYADPIYTPKLTIVGGWCDNFKNLAAKIKEVEEQMEELLTLMTNRNNYSASDVNTYDEEMEEMDDEEELTNEEFLEGENHYLYGQLNKRKLECTNLENANDGLTEYNAKLESRLAMALNDRDMYKRLANERLEKLEWIADQVAGLSDSVATIDIYN